MDQEINLKKLSTKQKQVQNIHYYFNENGLMVFTERYHQERGYCCKSGCKHCPFGFKK
jgi:hypothetical protein